jgi:hypothetical protein
MFAISCSRTCDRCEDQNSADQIGKIRFNRVHEGEIILSSQHQLVSKVTCIQVQSETRVPVARIPLSLRESELSEVDSFDPSKSQVVEFKLLFS